MTEKQIYEFCSNPTTIEIINNGKSGEIVEYFSKNGMSINLKKAEELKILSKYANNKQLAENLDNVSGGAKAGIIAAEVLSGVVGSVVLACGSKIIYDALKDFNNENK